MAMAALGNLRVLSTCVSAPPPAPPTACLHGSGSWSRPGRMKAHEIWSGSRCVLPPTAFPSPLLPPAVVNSVSFSPRALISAGVRLQELSQGFRQGVRVLPWSVVRKSSLGPVRSMAGKPKAAQLEDLIKSKNELNPVVVYSKTWCPYCGQVKSLFKTLKVSFVLVELDELVEEQDVQAALWRISGQSTVPNVFIGGKHVGGCDDTIALHNKGQLIPLLTAAGAKFTP